MTDEEKKFYLKAQYMNPITGKKGQDVSGEHMSQCWVKLKVLDKELKGQYRNLCIQKADLIMRDLK